VSDAPRESAWKAWLALAIALAVYALLQVAPLRHGGNANDFKHIYAGAVLLAEGANPYDTATMMDFRAAMAKEDARFANGILPYVYLPFTGIVLRPLAWMPFRAAELMWQFANHALLLAGLALAAAASGWRFSWRAVALLGATVAFNYTVFRQNNAGQLNMVLVFGSALLAFGISRGWKPAALGFVAAFLMLFKLSPGIFLVWFLLTRRWREAAWTAGWAAAMTLGCVALVGVRVHLDFLPVLADMGFGKSTWADLGQTFWRDPYNQSFNAFFHHVLVDWPGARHWIDAGPLVANAATWLAALAMLGMFGWRTARGTHVRCVGPAPSPDSPPTGRSHGDTNLALSTGEGAGPTPFSSSLIPHPSSFALALLASLLLPSILWDHYLTQALVACVLLWPDAGRLLRGAIVAAVAVWSLGFAHDAGFFHPGVLAGLGLRFEIPAPGWNGPLQPLWMSLKLWPLAAVFAIASMACGTRREAEKSGS